MRIIVATAITAMAAAMAYMNSCWRPVCWVDCVVCGKVDADVEGEREAEGKSEGADDGLGDAVGGTIGVRVGFCEGEAVKGGVGEVEGDVVVGIGVWCVGSGVP